jgi:hypothetical protein
MRTEKDVEAYLLRSNRRYRTVDSPEGQRRTFFVDSGSNKPPVAVLVDPPLVVLRVHIGDLASPGAPVETALFRQLLEFNARQLVHASYGLEDAHVVLSSALELENLDFNEIQATLDEIDVALAQQLSLLAAKGGLKTNLG